MPRRLLMAAEILMDVARTVNACDRPLLEAAASELTVRAEEICTAEGKSVDLSPEMATLLPSIRQLAAALDPEVDYARGLFVH